MALQTYDGELSCSTAKDLDIRNDIDTLKSQRRREQQQTKPTTKKVRLYGLLQADQLTRSFSFILKGSTLDERLQTRIGEEGITIALGLITLDIIISTISHKVTLGDKVEQIYLQLGNIIIDSGCAKNE
ncbi:hypothetical protein CHS0354_012132 [Potamilus streckersoni]|uniref:Uncharacterized protein n=1 Tax=Potamilus streckersoni TaxID=2493646 RepID=A0AAE0SAF2_9BIVA|nr:hypothetical protein CHS0354_012132 [Potamilus streckersoni]